MANRRTPRPKKSPAGELADALDALGAARSLLATVPAVALAAVKDSDETLALGAGYIVEGVERRLESIRAAVERAYVAL